MRLNPHQILLVDDEEAVLRTLRRFLARDGFLVQTARNAADALAQLRAGLEPHVVISDFRMPGEDGIAFLKHVRQEWPMVQRVLMTGHADISALEEAINASQIYRFLPKPWDERSLLATVRSAVVQWELENENARLQALTHQQNRQLTDSNRELEAKIAERTRLVSRAKREWEVAFDALSEPVMIIDNQYRIVRANLALAAHLGRDIKELPGAVCHELRAGSPNPFPRDADGVCRGCPVRRVREGGQGSENEVSIEERIFSIGAFPIAEDERDATVCRYRDLTDQRALARQMAQADKLAAIGLLAGGVAHEINNPLGAILAFSQLLRREPLEPDETRDYLREIEESALRCKQIVERLLSFARHARRDERRTFNLNDVVGETAFLVEKSYLPTNVKLVRELDPDLWNTWGNFNEIAQVLLNLVSNARDALPTGGEVHVRTRNLPESEGLVELVVADNGAGIPPELLQRIFDPFFTTKPEGKGTGLGLAVSYGIIRDHRGRIEVTSRLGEGTEVHVTLPRARPGSPGGLRQTLHG
jgi:signal transduction histidine kinase/FixJ family two-component response regulator